MSISKNKPSGYPLREPFNLYRIYADYSPCQKEPIYKYVMVGRSVSDAKKRFSQLITWLNIYACREMTYDEYVQYKELCIKDWRARLGVSGLGIFYPEYKEPESKTE